MQMECSAKYFDWSAITPIVAIIISIQHSLSTDELRKET
jgi:hypothetical protein